MDFDTAAKRLADTKYELAVYFDEKFGPAWKDEKKAFWDEFTHMIRTRFATDRT